MLKKQWQISKSKNKKEDKQLDPVIQEILFKRGLKNKAEIDKFLYGTAEDLEDPFAFNDMEIACNRILEAIDKKEKIIVYGDYDVDGISSTTLLYKYFRKRFDFTVDFYLPDRHKEGYGLNLEAVNKFTEKGYKLLITVDCGITAIEEVELAAVKGIDVIITDHHQAAEVLPSALAIIDPHRKGENYPFKELAGVGVAYKLCQALEYKVESCFYSNELEELLEIVCLGTVADIVALKGENRIFVKKGLELINQSKNPGLSALIEIINLSDKEITTGHIGYMIAPHLNAIGRIGNPEDGIKLLIEKDKSKARDIALSLHAANKERQKIEKQILFEAKEMIKDINLEEEKSIILASDSWHHGVIGIVASKLVELYYRPTILIAIDGDHGRASCRSIAGLDIHQALLATSFCLGGFGGHKMAAGLSISTDKIEQFKQCFNDYLEHTLSKEDLIPPLKTDALLEIEDINMKFYQNLSLLEPYGMANPRPVFALSNVKIAKAYPVGQEKSHLKFSLARNLEGIGFGFGNYHKKIENKKVDLAFCLELNHWQDKIKLQLSLKDINLRENFNYFPICFNSGKYILADKRGLKDHCSYLKNLLVYRNKIAIYINNYNLLKKYKKEIEKQYLYIGDKDRNFTAFQESSRGVIIITPSMKFDRLDVEELFFSSLPFSIDEIKQVISRMNFGRLKIHLLFSEKDFQVNQKIIKNSLPDADYLRNFYKNIKSQNKTKRSINALVQSLKEKNHISVNKTIIERSLTILDELNLLEHKGEYIEVLTAPLQKLDLSSSISYNNNINNLKDFQQLKQLAEQKNLFPLLEELIQDY